MKRLAVLTIVAGTLIAQLLQGQVAPQNGYYPQGGPDNGPVDVSMIQLIANPQSYDGKLVPHYWFPSSRV